MESMLEPRGIKEGCIISQGEGERKAKRKKEKERKERTNFTKHLVKLLLQY